MRLLLVILALASSGCSKTSEDAAGTTNPEVTTPVEIPPDAPAYSEADSVAADTASG